ncbi:MAG: hypothetical protein KDB54_02325 [Solirubrobacterales bacterium]|nr:hypothetical protein [Solirubrobacterales bacterium]
MKVVGVTLHGGTRLIAGTGPRPIEAGHLPVDDFTGILGRNDSGKSTLLNCVHDLLSGSDGLNGIVFVDVEPDRFDEILRPGFQICWTKSHRKAGTPTGKRLVAIARHGGRMKAD